MQRCIGRLADVEGVTKAAGIHSASRLTSKIPYLCTHSFSIEFRKRLSVSCASESQGAEVTTIRSRPAVPVAKGDPERSRFSGTYEGQSPILNGEDANVWQLQGAISRGEWKRAVSITAALETLGSDVDAEEVSGFITALCRAGKFNSAWRLHTLFQGGPSLKIGAYKRLILSAFEAGEPYRALQGFRSMQQAGLEPNVALWANVISLLCRQRGSRRVSPCDRWAFELWDELYSSGMRLDAPAIAAGMNACIAVGRVDEAERLLERMHQQGFRVDARAYNLLLKGYARTGKIAKMRELLEEMQHRGVEPSTASYNTMISVHVRRQDMAEAQRILRKARAAGMAPDGITYNSLMKGFAMTGDLDSAAALLEEMREEGLQPSHVTYSTLIDGHVRAGQLEQALRLLREMGNHGLRPNIITYNTLLKGYCMTEPPSLAAELEVLQEMSREGVRPDVDTFNILMGGRLRSGDYAAVARLFRQLLGMGYCPDSISYTSLIAALARLGRFQDAVRAFEEMERDERVMVDLAAMNALVDAFARSGQMDAAEQALDRALYLAQTSGQPPPIHAFGAVVRAYARQRQLEPALQTVRRFYDLGGTPDAAMFDVLVDLAVRTGQFKRAMQVVRAMERVGARADKQRIKTTLEEMIRRQQAGSPSPKARRRNENLERFKFWLGLPNRYYAEE